ncbi:MULTISPECIES: DNA polymerase III subunit chi [Neorhizobium]|jgi:DNA polymerase-3 subunit chi|uniref:DNA polymerase III subunit chi n=3 Tax=Neorhizobium galegae TaxID=399 RepID=A0A068SNA4_NEOGA|nr:MULTISPECIES: DNA polymerase III subunit chi [Neorhizobium]KAB1085953.1 DNA polymerase III subunit chi [Neorhizobium galegae]MCJ9671098.1 DNA polymerase III subunit chi [Neorhizobium sp. SHOUNA12B]MCJ9743725.1 DNA polymerase III subunit chi [Neorhizobium sp. SHOUNA12A]MCJ9751148.1 DNA polymerase III subunit chi [Neorhizobium sp. BETTINA12A]MCQ1850206.1 DNA polymerase III subunit chi [Neorhizobium galegae]
MTEVLFYHLTESKLEDALPALLEKSVERGWKVAVQTSGDVRRDFLDAHLWTFREDSFLPHGTDASPMAEAQPVLLTSAAENGNGATVRFLVDGAEPPPIADYDRIVFMFDGYDAVQLDNARAQWKKLKGEGHALTYWQQSEEGRWVKKA